MAFRKNPGKARADPSRSCSISANRKEVLNLQMPTVLFTNGFRFYFYSNENDEPMHIHVEKGDGNGKIWLEPVIAIAYMHNFSTKEINQIIGIVGREIVTLRNKWNEFFS